MVGFRDCDLGGAAIRAPGVERDSDRRRTAHEPGLELEGRSVIGALATVAIATAALTPAVSPGVIAMRLVALPAEWVVTGLGRLGAAAGGVKLIAMAWAIGPPARAAAAIAD